MYESDVFKHGIDCLKGAVEGWGSGDRKHILKLLLADLKDMPGNSHDELVSYLAELFLFPDDPVDFDKLNELHHEFSVSWGSAMNLSLEKERAKVDLLLPAARAHFDGKQKRSKTAERGAAANAAKAQVRKDVIGDWVDVYLGQRKSSSRPTASDLATRLLKVSDFQWPEGKRLSWDDTRKKIGKHLKTLEQ